MVFNGPISELRHGILLWRKQNVAKIQALIVAHDEQQTMVIHFADKIHFTHRGHCIIICVPNFMTALLALHNHHSYQYYYHIMNLNQYHKLNCTNTTSRL